MLVVKSAPLRWCSRLDEHSTQAVGHFPAGWKTKSTKRNNFINPTAMSGANATVVEISLRHVCALDRRRARQAKVIIVAVSVSRYGTRFSTKEANT